MSTLLNTGFSPKYNGAAISLVTKPPLIDHLFHTAVQNTELLPTDTREQYRQKLARITLDSMVQFVGLLDARGTVLEINQFALDSCGLQLSDVEGKPFRRSFWWQVSEEINRELRESILRAAQGEFVRWDSEVYTRTGSKETMIIDASLTPVRDQQGNVVFIAAEWRDVSARRRAEQNANLLASIVESSEDAIVSKRLDGVITSWNKGAERLFGYTADEVIGQSIAILIPPDRAEEEPQIIERLKRGERVDHFDTFRLRKDQTLVNVSLTISPVKNADGRIVGASKVARDITERARQEAALRELNTALRLANIDLQHFAFAAAHDLQEPLRMVTTYTQLLSRVLADSLNDDSSEYIRQVIGGSKRMSALLHDLLAYTEVSRDQDKGRVAVNLNLTLQAALANLDEAIRESGAIVQSDSLPTVSGNEIPLLQLFQNLISNAIKYRSEAAPRVQISVVQAGAEWTFRFRDNGIGIAPEYHERVFGVFKRLHGKEIPGTGIGLAICQRVVERLGGRIWVESEGCGNGSAFCFTLPAAISGRSR